MKRVLIALISSAALLAPGVINAQGGSPSVYVHTTTATPTQASAGGVAALKVNTLFSLLDSAGMPTSSEIDHIELRVGQDRYTATFGKPSGQWAIAVLLDTSGTLAGNQDDFRRMIEGFSKSLDQMPQNALYTIVTFDSSPRVIQEFTADKEEVRKNILTAVKPKAGSKPCLNDGLLEAVRRVESASARKAVVVVTASQDACGNTPLQAVVDEATSTGTQIHALGIDGYAVNLATLEKYTQPTRGLAYIRSPNDLIFGLGSLLSGLANQYEANWTIYPRKGEQTDDMFVTLKDSSVLNGKITFVSDKDYEPPPKVDLIGEVRSTPASLLVNLVIVNRAKIAALQARIIDKTTGKALLDQLLPKVEDSLAIPANTLQTDGNYTLEINALDAQNNILSSTPPRDFQFKPTPLQIGIVAVSAPSLDSSNFVVTVTTPSGGAAGIARYKAWLETEQSNGPIAGTEVFQSPDQPLTIPAADLPSGVYQVKAQALDGANQIIAEAAKPFKVDYTRPSFIDRIVRDVGQSSVAVVVLVVVAIVAILIVFMLFRYARSRSRVEVRVVEPELDRKHYRAPASDRSQVIIQPEISQMMSGPINQPAQAVAGAAIVMREPSTLLYQAKISTSRFTLGRSATNDGVIKLDSQSGVSGSHAVVLNEGGIWYVQDSNSTNGTSVNGQKLPRGGRMRLQDHAVIGLGPKVKLEFRILS
ncbi:MAG: FHA domain-containing protein [Chloroflexi bacterium]|nr:FHA domain-containing protein [Chloroflexota bacterium]MCL5275585.1 FHA domain-containing protein [Chloroflexota bacterium]